MSSAAALDRTLAALADPHRRQVVELLRDRPRRAGELADAVGLQPAALSRHLRHLRRCGLVEETHPAFDARVRIYQLRSGPMSELKAWLDETERLWSLQLTAFREHLETSWTSKVLVSLRVPGRPDRAFTVFTQEIALWWRPNDLFQFTPRSPGRLAFEPGRAGVFTEILPDGKVFEIGRIRVWDPPYRLVFGWRQATFAPNQDTEVEVRFEPVGEETRVTVEHRGWDSVPSEHAAKHGFPSGPFLARHGEWWRSLLAAFKQETATRAPPTTGSS